MIYRLKKAYRKKAIQVCRSLPAGEQLLRGIVSPGQEPLARGGDKVQRSRVGRVGTVGSFHSSSKAVRERRTRNADFPARRTRSCPTLTRERSTTRSARMG
jgi:hypothetical protein